MTRDEFKKYLKEGLADPQRRPEILADVFALADENEKKGAVPPLVEAAPTIPPVAAPAAAVPSTPEKPSDDKLAVIVRETMLLVHQGYGSGLVAEELRRRGHEVALTLVEKVSSMTQQGKSADEIRAALNG